MLVTLTRGRGSNLVVNLQGFQQLVLLDSGGDFPTTLLHAAAGVLVTIVRCDIGSAAEVTASLVNGSTSSSNIVHHVMHAAGMRPLLMSICLCFFQLTISIMLDILIVRIYSDVGNLKFIHCIYIVLFICHSKSLCLIAEI